MGSHTHHPPGNTANTVCHCLSRAAKKLVASPLAPCNQETLNKLTDPRRRPTQLFRPIREDDLEHVPERQLMLDKRKRRNLVISRNNRSKTFPRLRQANMTCPAPSEICPAPFLSLSKHTRKEMKINAPEKEKKMKKPKRKACIDKTREQFTPYD